MPKANHSKRIGFKKSSSPSLEYDMGFACLDFGREARTGIPEVVFGEGKTVEQICAIAKVLLENSGRVLITRITASIFEQVRRKLPTLCFDSSARCAYAPKQLHMPKSEKNHREKAGIKQSLPGYRNPDATVVVIAAGTSDLPIADEAALTCQFMGCQVKRVNDVGVAGLHRLMSRLEVLRTADALIVVAGMDAALASVIAGLINRPLIGVPTSVGYGAGAGGQAPLLSMLNACAPGLTVVNIDNGFGAGVAAARIALQSSIIQ